MAAFSVNSFRLYLFRAKDLVVDRTVIINSVQKDKSRLFQSQQLILELQGNLADIVAILPSEEIMAILIKNLAESDQIVMYRHI